MILLDTHIWIWWVQQTSRLSPVQQQHLADNQTGGLGVSVISIWEIAMLEANGRLNFFRSVEEWTRLALTYPGIRLLDLNRDRIDPTSTAFSQRSRRQNPRCNRTILGRSHPHRG